MSSTVNTGVKIETGSDQAKLIDGDRCLKVEGIGEIRPAFASLEQKQRLLRAGRRNEPLARAIGLKPGQEAPMVLDATGGLGRDAMLLAHLGCDVLMLECQPLLFRMLIAELNLQRAVDSPPAWTTRLEILHGDSADWLALVANVERVIYLDPMHPARRKSALVKKEMQALQALLGEPNESDSNALLAAALATTSPRVVSKRPADQPPLLGPEPHHAINAGQIRFDVYCRG